MLKPIFQSLPTYVKNRIHAFTPIEDINQYPGVLGGVGGTKTGGSNAGGGPIWNPDPDFTIQDRMLHISPVIGRPHPIRRQVDRLLLVLQLRVIYRGAGGLEREADFPVDATADADDTSNQPNDAATVGTCLHPDQGEVQRLYHTSL